MCFSFGYVCVGDPGLEGDSDGGLNLPLRIDNGRDRSRCTLPESRVGQTELGCIQDIESFNAQFPAGPFKNLRVLGKREIEVVEAGPTKYVTAGIAKCVLGGS